VYADQYWKCFQYVMHAEIGLWS